jgi:hypothetical protein
MATVTGFTASRTQEIEDANVIGAHVTGGHLILEHHDGSTTDAGSVAGTAGPTGPAGPTSIVVCTSTTRPTGGALFVGLKIYETDTDSEYVYTSTGWKYTGPRLPHSQTYSVPNLGTTSSTGYVDLTVPVQIAGFKKYRSDSELKVTISGSLTMNNGSQQAFIAVNIDGAVTFVAIIAALTSGSPHDFTNTVQIPGIGEGTISLIKVQWYVSFSSVVLTSYDNWTLTVEETLP